MCIKEVVDDYAFYFIDDVNDPFIQLISIGHQLRNTEKYNYNNSSRRNAYLLQYTLNGSGTFVINSQQHLIDKEKGFFIKLPSDTQYYFDKSNNRDWEFIYMLFKGVEIERYYDYISKRNGNVFSLPLYHPAVHKMTSLFEEIKSENISDAFSTSSKTFEIICSLCSLNNSKHLDTVEKAKEYMQINFDKGIGIAEVSGHLGISQSHLSRQFYSETNQKPIDYLTKIKIEKSIDLLLKSDQSVEDISKLCGFSCGNYFNKVFRKYLNISPTQFRQTIKKEQYSKVHI